MRAAAFLSVLLVALAGCSDGGSDPAPPAPEPDPKPPAPPGQPEPAPAEPVTEIELLMGFNLTDCAGLRMSVPAPLASIQSHLPDGYVPLAIASAGTPADLGYVVADGVQCASFDAAGAVFEDVWFGRVFTYLDDAPEPVADADQHAYLFEMLATPDIFGLLWPAAGFPTTIDNATFQEIVPGAVFALDWGNHSWEAAVESYPATLSDATSFAWYHELENGNTNVWTGTVRSQEHAGTGTLDAPAGSVIHTTGPATNPFGFAGGVASYQEAGSFDDMSLVQHLAEPL